MSSKIEIGVQFKKELPKGKSAQCVLVDVVQRISTKTGKIISEEYWAKSDTYNFGKAFEVAKNTIIRGL